MRHESERAGQGTRGSEGERGQERERGKGVGATGGRGDCRNKAGKGKKGRYYRISSTFFGSLYTALITNTQQINCLLVDL